MSDRQKFRRPAMLSPAQAEMIQGDEDPAAASEVAHSSAAALMRIGARDDAVVSRLITVIETEGVDAVSVLWSRSPATTLPGILWRLYLVREWFRREGPQVRARLREGIAAPHIEQVSAEQLAQFDEETVIGEIENLMHARPIKLVELLQQTAVLLRILASGATFGANWIESDDHDLADLVTRRGAALLATAAEFEEAAKRAGAGRLD